VFRPVILLPKSMDMADEKQLSYVLEHEFTHIRHFDGLTKLAATAALCVHWFNTLVWLMYVLLNRDIEISCDEKVVKSFGETLRSSYAAALLAMEEKKSRFAPLGNSFIKYAIEERIKSIMNIKKTSIIGIAVSCALVVSVAAVFATSATGAAEVTVWGNSGDTNDLIPIEIESVSGRVSPTADIEEVIITDAGSGKVQFS
jgi:beta-lactamase regulating signal transducer with metallopeptidase domain